jgi:hypothetical protein
MTDAFRHNALFAAVLFSIFATGIALLFRKRVALVAIAGLVALTVLALCMWKGGQSPPVDPASSVTSPTD